MTVIDHPGRTRAIARGDQAERLVQVGLDLAMLVRDEGPEAIGSFLGRLTAGDRYRLLIVLAAMVPVEVPEEVLLGWVTWDEHGRPLKGMTPVLPIFTADDGDEGAHGTYAAYCRHVRAGERNRDQLEACGCARAAREYYQERHARRKQEQAEAAGAA